MRYRVTEESETGHCCFEASVLDTSAPDPRRDGSIIKESFDVVCECFTVEAAQKIAAALNGVVV